MAHSLTIESAELSAARMSAGKFAAGLRRLSLALLATSFLAGGPAFASRGHHHGATHARHAEHAARRDAARVVITPAEINQPSMRFPAPPPGQWFALVANRALPLLVRARKDVDGPAAAPTVYTLPAMMTSEPDEADDFCAAEICDGIEKFAQLAVSLPLDADYALARAALNWPLGLRPTPARDAAARPITLGDIGAWRAQRSFIGILGGVAAAARRTAMDPATLMAIAEIESNFSPTAKARTSSASGLFQFVEGTWLEALKSFGERYGLRAEARLLARNAGGAPEQVARLLELRNDPYLSAAFAAEMLARDSAKLSRAIGRRLTAGETYLIHFLGAGDASRLIRANELAPHLSAAMLFPRPAQANQAIFYDRQDGQLKDRSVRDVHDVLEDMMSRRTGRYKTIAARLPAGVTAYTE